jgi:hypothetical protein
MTTAMSSDPPARDDTVSPPDAISPSSNPAAAASRTVVPTHFPHQPSAAAPVHPFLDTALPPLNAAPLELDSTPVTSPTAAAGQEQAGIAAAIARRASWKMRGAAAAGAAAERAGYPPGREVEAEEEEGDEKARLKAHDPAVLDGPLDTPNAEDFEAAKAGEGAPDSAV